MRIKPLVWAFFCSHGGRKIAAVGIDTSTMQQKGSTETKGLASFVPNDELQRREDEKVKSSRPTPEPVTRIAQFVQGVFEANKRGKQQIEQDTLRGQRRLAGQYEPDHLAAIKLAKMPIYFYRLSEEKCFDHEAQLNKIFSSMDDFCEIEPTPVPDLPEEIQGMIKAKVYQKEMEAITQEAYMSGIIPSNEEITSMIEGRQEEIEEAVKERIKEIAHEKAVNMQTKIEDQFVECNFRGTLKAVTKDIGRFKAVIVKGPVFRKEKELKFIEDPATGAWTAKVVETIKPYICRISPHNWFPQVDARRFGEGNNIEIEPVDRGVFAGLRGQPGYKDEAIEKVLTDYPNGYKINQDIDQQRIQLENQTTTVSALELTGYDIINLWGEIPGNMLLEWGMSAKEIPDPIKSYQVNVKQVGNHVIKSIINPDPLGRQPYQGTAFRKSNDSVWGECIPDLITATEDRANASLRALLKNMSLGATPLLEVDMKRLDTASGETGDVWAGKVFKIYGDPDGSGKPAVQAYSVDMHAAELQGIYEKAKQEADTLIAPSIWGAKDSVDTAAGQSMQRSDAAVNTNLVFENIYEDIIVPITEKLYTYNMMYLDDPSIKGDSRVKVKNIAQLMAKEQISIRRRELLPLTNNPTDMAIMGNAGRAAQLEDAFKSVEMDVDKLIPQLERIEKEGKMQQGQSAIGMMPGPGGTMIPQPNAMQLDAAGNPVAGQDTALFNQGGQQ